MFLANELDSIYNMDLDEYVVKNDIYEETFDDVWNNCVVLSVLSVIPVISRLVLLNIGLCCLLDSELLPKKLSHILSGLLGIYLINTLDFFMSKVFIYVCFISFYLLFRLYCYLKLCNYLNNTLYVKVISVLLLILCEYYLLPQDLWLQIRGIVMILTMKVISLSDDLDLMDAPPNFIEYFGYTLSGMNIMFGPWISFQDYLDSYDKRKKKNIWWFLTVCELIFLSLFFLTLSNCWSTYFLPENSNRLIQTYREAFSFRTSHYFISYMAEAGMVASGFGSDNWRYPITDPLQIELPSALVVVVRNWNRPMHDFLKRYFFRSFLSYGKFFAIFSTFLMSSFLHGLELRVSMVLVTIGLFSYLQVTRRDSMAKLLDCCIRTKACRNCLHRIKRHHLPTKLLLVIYSISTIWHLAYLGVLMDPSTEEIGIYEKWKHLYFSSHIIMLVNLIFFY